MFLKQSTQVVVKIGPFLDATDGVTEETGLAANATEISKSPGGAFAAGPTLGTHDAEGWYPITLTTSHTDTVGRLVVKSHDSATHLPVWHEFYVLEEAIYDALFAASANAYTGAAGSTDFNTTQKASINTEADTALTDIGLDHLLSASVAGTDVTDDSIVAKLVSASATADWDDFVNTTDSLQAIRDNHPANFSGMVVSGGGVVDANLSEIGGDTLSVLHLGNWALGIEVDSGTAQAGAGGSITLASSADSTNNDIYKGCWVTIKGGTGALPGGGAAQASRLITGYTASTRVATVTPSWTITPDSTSEYVVKPQGPINVGLWRNADVNQVVSGRVDAALGAYGSSLDFNATQKASINTEVDNALDTAIPVSPTAESINERVKAVDDAATEARLAELDAANLPADLDQVKADLPQRFTKNTALANFTFPMFDSADGRTLKTGLTVTGQVSKDGAAFGALTNAVTELSNGYYVVNLAAADLNCDTGALRFTASGADETAITFVTQPT